jgi:hypothetical protein
MARAVKGCWRAARQLSAPLDQSSFAIAALCSAGAMLAWLIAASGWRTSG